MRAMPAVFRGAGAVSWPGRVCALFLPALFFSILNAWAEHAPAAERPASGAGGQAGAPAQAAPGGQGDAAAPAAPAQAQTDREQLRRQVREAAVAAGAPPELADAVATVESNYNPAAVGADGEAGLMQVLPSTARLLGFTGTRQELHIPATNIRLGVAYLARAWELAGGDICTAVMKYRAGHGETRFSHRSVDYCVRVRAHLASQGYRLTGEVPVATFGAPIGRARIAARGVRRPAARSRYDWRAADARMNAIARRVNASTLTIAR